MGSVKSYVRPGHGQNGDVLVTVMPNALDPFNTIVEWRPWNVGAMLRDYAPESMPLPEGLDVAVSVNGKLLSEFEQAFCPVQPGDSLLFKVVPRSGGGGGKNPIGIVASLAMTLMAPGIGNAISSFAMDMAWSLANAGVAGGFWMGVASISGYLATGLTALGGMLINSVLPQPRPDTPSLGPGSSGLEESATYGWSAGGNPTTNGHPVAIPFGECFNVKPFLLTSFVTTDGDKQYLNMLFSCGEGPVDDISEVTVNGDPIGNYSNAQVVTRLGTQDQEIIPWFNDGIFEQAISAKLQAPDGENDNWTMRTTDGNAIQALGFGIAFSSGLFHVNDGGSLENVSVAIEVQYRQAGGEWQEWGTFTITEAKRSAVRRFWRLDGIPAAQYDVRARLASAPPSGTQYVTDCWWDYMQEIVPDDFRYPNTALLGINFLATDQLSGGKPEIGCKITRSTVPVFDGTAWVTKPANNPAWMAYDLLVNRRYGAGANYRRIIIDDFASAAEWCDIKGITGSFYIDSQMDLKTAVDHCGLFGRFQVVMRGTKIGCLCDRPADFPQQGFLSTMGNTISGSAGLGYLDSGKRADAVQVTYYDAVKGRTTILVRSQWFNSLTRQPNISRATLYCCNDVSLATKWGQYTLRCNQYLSRVWTEEVSVDALACKPGGVIQVAHDVPNWGESGRIVSATTTRVVLGRKVNLDPGKTYKIQVTHTDRQSPDTGDALVELRSLSSVSEQTLTDTVELAEAFDFAPSPGAVFSVGEIDLVSRWFRVTRITRSAKMRRKIEALEYFPEVYADEEGVSVPALPVGLAAVRGLQAAIFNRNEDGVYKTRVQLTWRGASISWSVFFRRSGTGSWVLDGTTKYPSYDVQNLEVGFIYDFAVTASGKLADAQIVSVDFTMDEMSGVYQEIVALDNEGVLQPVVAMIDGQTRQIYAVE